MRESGDWRELFLQGVALTDSGRPAKALVVFQRILRQTPAQPEVLGALGDAYRKLGALVQAQQACEQALALAPGNPFARLILARTLYEADDPAGAEAAYRLLVEQMPGNLDILNELVTILMVQGRARDALALVAGRLRADPGSSHLHFAKGFIHHHLMELEPALASYDLGLACAGPEPTRARLRWNRGLVRLLLGRMDDEAWDARELRGRIGGLAPRNFSRPAWDGAALGGRTVLLHGTGEGLGDAIMGLHYAAGIQRLGGRVLVEAAPELLELFRACPAVDAVTAAGEALPPYDCHAHLMSLPRLFRTRPDRIPWDGPYLVLPDRPSRQRQAIAELTEDQPGRVKIGLVYAGITCQNEDAALDPALLAGLARLRGRVRFFSLQKSCEPPLPPLPGELRANDLGGLLEDFCDAAWALARMDLLISVDTAMLHLAGAMGRPAAGLLAFLPDWRWQAAGARSPWYPSLRLYRQRARRGWAEVIQTLAQDLDTALVEGRFPDLPGNAGRG